MRCRPTVLLAAALALVLAPPAGARALDSDTAGQGLREVLALGAGKAVDALGVRDGLLGNPDVRIRMPAGLRSMDSVLRAVGQGPVVDELETSMNRAAEAAVPVAKQPFLDALEEMTYDDVLRMLRGSDHSATDDLEEHAGPRISELFKAVVRQLFDSVGATGSFEALTDKTRPLSLAGAMPELHLDDRVTGKANDGLLLVVAREENTIRTNGVARTTGLLQRVFGSKEARSALSGSESQQPELSATDELEHLGDVLETQ